MKNQLVASILYQIADLLDLKGEIFFKTRAYRIAAQTIDVLDEDIEIVSKENRLQELPGIGEALAKKIKEIVETGHLDYLDKLKEEKGRLLLKGTKKELAQKARILEEDVSKLQESVLGLTSEKYALEKKIELLYDKIYISLR